MSGPLQLSVCCITAAPLTAQVVRESLARALPAAGFSVVGPEDAIPGRLPPADCVVIDAADAPGVAAEMALALRAGGARGAIVVLVEEGGAAPASRLAGIGAVELLPVREAPRQLGDAVARALGGSGWTGPLDVLQEELRRTQRLVAAGEIALGLQHSMNNPLTAVLAEAQLLEMDATSEEMRTAVKRIIENTRRLVQLVRGLDPIGVGRKAEAAKQ